MATTPIGGNVVGIDPHKRTLSACVVNPMGAVLGVEHFNVSGVGHRALEAWLAAFGPVARIGIEGAGGLGRHTSVFFTDRDYDVRDVCPTRTAERSRQRRRGKSDSLDAERIGRETLAEPGLPRAFKLVDGGRPDPTRETIGLWHGARRSVAKIRQQLLGESEALLHQLPEHLRGRLPATKKIRPRLDAAAQLEAVDIDPVTAVRLSLLAGYADQITVLDAEERRILRELRPLISAAGSTLEDLCGIAVKSATEILVEVGDPRRFTEGGFARFNGTAPLPASSGEGDGEPTRHRLNRGGNRRVNAVLHRMAVTQLRCNPRAREIVDDARQRGHTKPEAMRILKRHLSNVVHRRMIQDQKRRSIEPLARSA
jgi:transposase